MLISSNASPNSKLGLAHLINGVHIELITISPRSRLACLLIWESTCLVRFTLLEVSMHHSTNYSTSRQWEFSFLANTVWARNLRMNLKTQFLINDVFERPDSDVWLAWCVVAKRHWWWNPGALDIRRSTVPWRPYLHLMLTCTLFHRERMAAPWRPSCWLESKFNVVNISSVGPRYVSHVLMKKEAHFMLLKRRKALS